MKVLIIGGNRFVGLRLSQILDKDKSIQLSVVNRTGQVAHVKNATIYKSDRNNLHLSGLDRDWDLIYDFACYSKSDAEASLEYFGNVGRYIFISTVSVYDQGASLKEEAFDPAVWDIGTPPVTDPVGAYQYGKRQAEAVFTQKSQWPTLMVRFPVILGPDDYTERLEFHLRRTQSFETIYAENPAAKFSMVEAGDAASFLAWAGKQTIVGPINVASKDPISLKGLCAQIELITEKRPTVQPVKTGKEEGISPYSPANDWFINVDRMWNAGFKTRGIGEWLPELIGLPQETPKGRLH